MSVIQSKCDVTKKAEVILEMLNDVEQENQIEKRLMILADILQFEVKPLGE